MNVDTIQMQKRLVIEQMLVREYEGKYVSISGEGYASADGNNWGIIRTIGVTWQGGDLFEVVMTFEGQRIVMSYDDFVTNVEMIKS